DSFKLSTDPQFVAKVVDVVGLYHNPPERAVVSAYFAVCTAKYRDMCTEVAPVLWPGSVP
ncbi:IS630 family transposase, partial [Streptomyces sp. NPDC127106]